MSIIGGASQGDSGYQIQNSLRLRASASAYLRNNNAGSWSNPDKVTFSVWVKRGDIGTTFSPIFGTNTGSNAFDMFGFQADQLVIRVRNSSSVDLVNLRSNDVFRDPSAWYHIVFIYDSGNATSTERAKIFVNNRQITSFAVSTYPSLNQAFTGTFITDMFVGRGNTATATINYADCYLAEVWGVDNRTLSPIDFGQYDSNGIWVPKSYGGDGGARTFYLPFSDGTNLTTLGDDKSGRNNDFTLNNISLTSGITYDWMTDTPSNNFPTLNPLDAYWATSGKTYEGNLRYADGTSASSGAFSSLPIRPTGKWYYENVVNASFNTAFNTGVMLSAGALANAQMKMNGSTSGVTGAGVAYANNDLMGIAIDADANTITVFKNGVQVTTLTPTSSISSTEYFAGGADGTSNVGNFGFYINFGQRPFAYTPPTGFKALCTANLPAVSIPNPKKHVDIKLRAGNGSTQSYSDLEFSPGLLWIKERAVASTHNLFNSVAGSTKVLNSNSTSAEVTTDALTSFDANGVTLKYPNTGDYYVNRNGQPYVDWLWKAGGAPVANTDGSITSQVSANTAAGFSIVSYTGNGANNANTTVGHGLGKVPSLIIIKARESATMWPVYHTVVGVGAALGLNVTNASIANGVSTWWNNTAPTSQVFTVGHSTNNNILGQSHIAYCFSEIQGYSKISSYTGNGSADGPFVYCGFRPKYVVIKRTNSIGNWRIFDAARDVFNEAGQVLNANGAEADSVAAGFKIDFVANGFKLRGNVADLNASGGTYIFMAFAEYPFGGFNVSPSPAR